MQSLVDQIAKSVMTAEPSDLGALVELQDRLQQLAEACDGPDLAPLADVARSAAELVESIVLRETEDEDGALELLRTSVDQIQQILDETTVEGATESPMGETGAAARADAAMAEGPAGEAAADGSESEAGGEGRAVGGREVPPDMDEELLAAWLTELDHSLRDLEAVIVEIDTEPDNEELIADARRRIHTIKGEAGVLSLGVIQRLCHEAETLIDARVDTGDPFPADECLALLDWLHLYESALTADPMAEAPPYEELLKQVTGSPAATGAEAVSEAVGVASAGAADAAGGDADVEAGLEAGGGAASGPVDLVVPEGDDTLIDFTAEAREHLENAEQALLELEHDPQNGELINTVFRAFHTIKGVAGFLNLGPIVSLAHSAETLLDRVRDGSIELNSQLMDVSLQSCDMLSQLIGACEGGAPPSASAHQALVDRLVRAAEGETELGAQPTLERTPDPSFHPLGEVLVGLGMATEEDLEEALERQAEGALALRQILIDAGLTDIDAVESSIEGGAEVGKVISERLVKMGFVERSRLEDAIEAKRQSGRRLGELLGLSAEELAKALREQRNLRRTELESNEAGSGSPTGAGSGSGPATGGGKPSLATAGTNRRPAIDKTVKVSTSRMDNLVTMVGELVIAQQMIVQDPAVANLTDQRVQRNLTHTAKIIRDLQEVAMSLRMVTVKGTFQKMARLVRDISRKSGKPINFVMEGEDTELDRNIVDEIGDPLVHMIRNACDHGIEASNDRSAKGKPESGTLSLRAYHQGGSIIIEVQDDGRGLDREAILAKAMERELIPADKDPAEIPDSEVFGLIFQAGFSTAKQVTDISGRGVGMDVVRRNIEALRGKVEIDSKRDEGSTFRIRLPLTMAIIDGMVVRVGTQRYVLPTLAIEQSFRPTDDQIHTAVSRGEMAMVRGKLLPIYRLNRAFELDEGAVEFEDGLLVVLEAGGMRCCLMVDEILGQQQVVIKSLGRGVGRIRGVSGGAILGDGRVALILDVEGLIQQATQGQPELAKAA